jgi:4-hydroxybenzoate polyprenyltransferase
MLSRQHKLLIMKIASLFSVVRGYNIPVIIIAQYLSAIFILAPEKRALDIVLNFNLFILVFASSLTIASGYIINNFYDSQKDLINRPTKSMLDRLVSQKTKRLFCIEFHCRLDGVVCILACIFILFRIHLFHLVLFS